MRQPHILIRLFLAGGLVLAAARCHEPTSAGNAGLSATITGTGILRWVERLAADSMRGRGTPSPQLDAAAATIAAYFQGLGLSGAFGPDAYVQRYPVPPGSGGADAAPNVAAVLTGSDNRLAGEYVVVVAHGDHKGIGAPVGLDSIYNGADDNASGTAGVLELARAFAATAPHPMRSVLFLVVSGEEEGYWGSQYFVAHAPVPIANVVAVITLDMISRSSPDSLQVGGRDRSSLGDVLANTLRLHPETGFAVTTGPTYGSDQVPFFGAGVPFLMFFAGLHADYHTPKDEADRIDPEKAARVARLAFEVAITVANTPARPARYAGGRPAAPGQAGAP